MWIDSHCHLNHTGIEGIGSAADIINLAKNAGVNGMVSVCCRMSEEINTLLDITNNNNNVWCSIGTHPHDASLAAEQAFTKNEIVNIASSHDKIIAIGESGLDYFYDNSPRDQQQDSFRKHINAAIESNLPLIVHSRDADDDSVKIMREEGRSGRLTGVMHCFSSSQELADKTLDMGFYISLSGIITFKKADELRGIAKTIPLDRILVETDAPFLAPMPYRGKANQPAYVVKTGEFLADIYGLPHGEFAKITTDNFFRLFKKARYIGS